jgi:WD40 repeat protein
LNTFLAVGVFPIFGVSIMSREALAYSILLSIASSLPAADPVRLDRFGDPLPNGAIYRLGTTRYRPSNTYGQFALSPDGKVFATGEYREVRVWDVKTGKPIWSCQLPGEMKSDRLLFSPDSQTLMVIAWETGRGTNLYIGFQFDVSSGAPRVIAFNLTRVRVRKSLAPDFLRSNRPISAYT